MWTGIFPDDICHNRQEVVDTLVRNRPRAPRITRIEAEEKGNLVAISVEGPDFQGDPRLIVICAGCGAHRSGLFQRWKHGPRPSSGS